MWYLVYYIQYVVLGPRVKVINLNMLPESSCNELKYSLKIAFMILSIILKFQVPNINILFGIHKKATVAVAVAGPMSRQRKMIWGSRWQLSENDWYEHNIKGKNLFYARYCTVAKLADFCAQRKFIFFSFYRAQLCVNSALNILMHNSIW